MIQIWHTMLAAAPNTKGDTPTWLTVLGVICALVLGVLVLRKRMRK